MVAEAPKTEEKPKSNRLGVARGAAVAAFGVFSAYVVGSYLMNHLHIELPVMFGGIGAGDADGIPEVTDAFDLTNDALKSDLITELLEKKLGSPNIQIINEILADGHYNVTDGRGHTFGYDVLHDGNEVSFSGKHAPVQGSPTYNTKTHEWHAGTEIKKDVPVAPKVPETGVGNPPVMVADDSTIQKPTLPRHDSVTQSEYALAEATLGGADGNGTFDRYADADTVHTSADTNELISFMHKKGVDITPAQAAEILRTGGYSVGSHNYELWVTHDRAITEDGRSPFYVTEKPGVQYAPIDGGPAVGDAAPVTPYELSQSATVLEHEQTSTFTGENPYLRGTREFEAWNNIHTYLTTHAETGWEQNKTPIRTYLATIKALPPVVRMA